MLKSDAAFSSKDISEAEQGVNRIVATIKGLIESDDAREGVDQVALNLAFRSYFQLLRQHGLADRHFAYLWEAPIPHTDARVFHMLYAVLQTNHSQQLNVQQLQAYCLEALTPTVKQNSDSLLAIIKTLNLLRKRFPVATLDMSVPLEHVYHCLQSGQHGVREETLLLFTNCCKAPQRANDNFQYIIEFWPWTNRNKLYLLSCILSCHSLQNLMPASVEEFFAGVRISLNYKSLLAASQYLVSALSGQSSRELLQLCVDVLTRGSRKEIQNLHAQWFSRIGQKEELFELLQQQPEIARFLEDSSSASDATENFRLVLIFSMFSRQIFEASKLYFFKISTELITNCFQHEVESQMLIFRFIVENLASFAIEDCLEFMFAFIRHHRSVDNAQCRNGILGRLPTVINYISKTFRKLHAGTCTTLGASISMFFQQLQMLIETDIYSAVYQPKIFALKLCEILLKSLYAQEITKNAKNCSLVHNQQLGSFLIEERQVFHAEHMSAQLFGLLNDPLGYDDALELIVSLLGKLRYDSEDSLKCCMEFCQRCDIDECALSTLYARVALQRVKADEVEASAVVLYNFAFSALNAALPAFKRDPLEVCRREHHLFGFLSTINEVVSYAPKSSAKHFEVLLNLLDEILTIVLAFLNLANLRGVVDVAGKTAASFQDMDESLQMLVQESSYSVADHDNQRKFLLMSFWLTLKACCDLATSIGCALATTSEYSRDDLAALERCLNVNVAVLTRCRHKGAIESAGLSVGRLTRCITSQKSPNSQAYELLHNCLALLFDASQLVSTTRRGAGLSIMLLHIVKNEKYRSRRPILQRVMHNIWQQLLRKDNTSPAYLAANCDRMEALTLHYLCVLVKDTDLRNAMSPHYSEIMQAAITQIDNPEWTVCNAALQLFGALVPKIVGQRQAAEFEAPIAWEPTEVTYSEITLKLPKLCSYILQYCRAGCSTSSTRSIILFLSFLVKVEHLCKGDTAADNELIRSFRELMWRLLSHHCDKVRQLAAVCFVRAHELRTDLPQILLAISQMIFAVRNENFFEGLVFTLSEGMSKLQHEGKYTLPPSAFIVFTQQLQTNLAVRFEIRGNFKPYTLCKLLKLLLQLGFNRESCLVSKLVSLQEMDNVIGRDVMLQEMAGASN